jgi:TRAP-type mannitol/chloroaromatic compound transport system permease small subunit
MNSDQKEKIMIGLDIVFASISLIALGLFYSSMRYRMDEVMDWLLSLEWYWYGLIFIITIIHPVVHLLKYLKKRGK